MEKLTLEEKIARVKDFRPIDDTFFEVMAQDPDVCQEMLQVILEDPNLQLIDSKVQKSVRNLVGRSVRLDAYCRLGDGRHADIEVQRADDDDHLRRARYNAACITASESNTGDKFQNVPDVIVIYISEFDMFKKEKTIYHVKKILEETGDVIDDGLTEIFVNTKINDGSLIAELMSCFLKKEVNDSRFPYLSNRVKFLKESEGGLTTVCEVMEKYAKEYAEERDNDKIISALKNGDSPNVIARIMQVPLEAVLKIQEGLLVK